MYFTKSTNALIYVRSMGLYVFTIKRPSNKQKYGLVRKTIQKDLNKQNQKLSQDFNLNLI